jgi:hypothetical protein
MTSFFQEGQGAFVLEVENLVLIIIPLFVPGFTRASAKFPV